MFLESYTSLHSNGSLNVIALSLIFLGTRQRPHSYRDVTSVIVPLTDHVKLLGSLGVTLNGNITFDNMLVP